MTERFDFDAIAADDALLDLLATGGDAAVELREAGDDTAVRVLAGLRLAVEEVDDHPAPVLVDSENFLARVAARNPVTDPLTRKIAARSLALSVAAVAALSVSGVSAAVNGDPLSPYEKVIERVVDAVSPQTTFPVNRLDGLLIGDKSKMVQAEKDLVKQKAEEDGEADDAVVPTAYRNPLVPTENRPLARPPLLPEQNAEVIPTLTPTPTGQAEAPAETTPILPSEEPSNQPSEPAPSEPLPSDPAATVEPEPTPSTSEPTPTPTDSTSSAPSESTNHPAGGDQNAKAEGGTTSGTGLTPTEGAGNATSNGRSDSTASADPVGQAEQPLDSQPAPLAVASLPGTPSEAPPAGDLDDGGDQPADVQADGVGAQAVGRALAKHAGKPRTVKAYGEKAGAEQRVVAHAPRSVARHARPAHGDAKKVPNISDSRLLAAVTSGALGTVAWIGS